MSCEGEEQMHEAEMEPGYIAHKVIFITWRCSIINDGARAAYYPLRQSHYLLMTCTTTYFLPFLVKVESL